MSQIAENLSQVRTQIAEAARRAGRSPDEISLLVVSKTWPAETVREVVEAGQILFGENRLQEGQEKVPALPDHLEWHFIGGMQRNKVRKILPLFPVIHSISSTKLAKATDRIASEMGLKPRVFLEVNIGEEEAKHGFTPGALRDRFEELLELENFHIEGLMCLPPKVSQAEDSRPWFQKVRLLQEDLEQKSGRKFEHLSMGMSRDFEIAIEEGSTIVRVGSAIFGSRERKP